MNVSEKLLNEWETKYKPMKNHINTVGASWAVDDEGGMMFETYGDEVEFVRSQPNENVWTWVDGDQGTWIINGFRLVNRIGYFVTEEKWTEDCAFEVDTYTEGEINV